LIRSDGAIILFPSDHNGAARVWQGGNWREDTTLVTEGIVRDAILVENGCWRLVSQVSNEDVVLHEYSGSQLRLLGRLSGKFERPTLHQGTDGSLWVASAEGSAYGLKDGRAFTHEFGAEVNKKGGCYTYYPPTLSFAVPDRGLWFWSHVQHEGLDSEDVRKSVIKGFDVYQDGKWRVVSHEGGKLGGAILRDSKTIIAGSRYDGIFTMDVESGVVHKMDIALPPYENPMFLHRTAAGRLLTIVARRAQFVRLSPAHDGWIGQLLALKDGRVRTLLTNVDFKRVCHDKGRPTADVPEGTFLAEAHSGLLFVSSDLDMVKRLDWRYGIPVPNIDRMRILDRCLCILDRERGFAILDYPRLLRIPESSATTSWAVLATAAPATICADKSIWYVTASDPAEVCHRTGTNETRISTAGSEFPVEHLWYLTTDSKSRPWLISNFVTHRTAFLDQGKWRTFDLRETAYSTVAMEEAGHSEYHVGNPSEHCYPVFAGDGRVAYHNEWGRICVFDGEKWDAGYGQGKIDGRSPEGPPFYRGGVLTVRAGDGYYEHLKGRWQATHADVRSPYGEHPRRNYESDIPRSFPGDTSKSGIRIRDNQGTMWIGDADSLWRGLNDIWVPFPVRGSPIGMASGVTSIQVDGTGSIWFTLGGGDYTRLARYQPDGSPPTVVWDATPAAESDTGSFESAVRATGSGARFIVRHQLDDGVWQEASVTQRVHVVHSERIPNGSHTIRVQLFDDLLRASVPLEHAFTVSRDYEQEVRTWSSLLLSSEFAQRELAAKELVSIGHPSLSALRRLERDAHIGQQWWIRAVKEEIERQSRGAKQPDVTDELQRR